MPDHFARDLIAVTFAHIVIHMLLIVEPNHATVVVAAPVLRVDSY